MLEKLIVQTLLYAMMLMGGLGALGMLTTSYLPKNDQKNTEVKSNLKEKWTNLWKTKRQAVEPYEPVCLVSVTFLSLFLDWLFPVFKIRWGRNAAGIYLYVAAIIPTALLC